MKKVEFLAPHSPYAAGDIAGIEDDAEAKALVEAGVCKIITDASNKMVDAPPAAKAVSSRRKTK